MEENSEEKQRTTQRSELILIGLLVLFGIGSIVFGVIRLNAAIRNPFQISPASEQQGSLLDGVDQGGIDIKELKSKDTDRDGLDDYQEIYIIQTSQYLSDSDGDGISDKEEIARGSNPNCPEGKTCFGKDAVVRTPINAALPPSQADTLDPSKAQGGIDPTQAINQVLSQFQNRTPQEIRAFLKEQGIPEEQLKQVPDVLLQAMYSQGIEQAVKQIKERGITMPPPQQPQTQPQTQLQPQTPEAVKPADLSSLTPQEIRALLERSGKVPLDVLQKVPDDSLKDIFMKAIQSTPPPQSAVPSAP